MTPYPVIDNYTINNDDLNSPPSVFYFPELGIREFKGYDINMILTDEY